MNDQENRLVDVDRDRMRARVAGMVAEWRRQAVSATWAPSPTDMLALERVAVHSIGCTADDLRSCELAEVAELVGAEVSR